MDERDDIAHLLARIALRDTVALESLYRQVAGRLVAVAWRVVQDRALAEDMLQEVFISIWNQADKRAPGQSLTLAWLCVITRNRAIDALRKKKPEQALHWQDSDGNTHMHDVVDDTGSPLEQLLASEDGQRLGHCMGALELEPRQAVMLAFYEGLTHPEIAQRMRRPLGTVKAWTRRSLQRLKGCMEAAA
jgi:RNA polymerase sigma-70 factor, ECF subfamily